MSKKPIADQEWRITCIKGSRAEYVGRVSAPDEKSAIERAIAEFEVTNPEHQRRLTERPANGHMIELVESYLGEVVVPVAPKGAEGWSQQRKSTGSTPFRFTERHLSFPNVDAELPRAFYFPKSRTRQLIKGYNSSFSSIINELNWRFEKGQRAKSPADHFKHQRKALHEKVISETDGDTLKKTLDAADSDGT